MLTTLSFEAKQALEGSYEKWIGIAEGTGEDKREENCPLCQIFNLSDCTKDNEESYTEICIARSKEECPISQYSGEGDCKNTPYYDWLSHQINFHFDNVNENKMKVQCPKCKEFAEDMIKFLDEVRKYFEEE
jgi:hypothetical protein